MARQWPSGLRWRKGRACCACLAVAAEWLPVCDRRVERRARLRAFLPICCTPKNRYLVAGGLSRFVLVGGVALGSYTTGGFKVTLSQPTSASQPSPAERGVSERRPPNLERRIDHVCKGCDAKLYREDAWYKPTPHFDTDDEWAREDRESRDAVRVALADEPRAKIRACRPTSTRISW